MPEGKRRLGLETKFKIFLQQAFSSRVLSFDESSAYIYGEIMALSKNLGPPMSVLDGQIAAIALANNSTLATRNVKDFKHTNLKLVNPFN